MNDSCQRKAIPCIIIFIFSICKILYKTLELNIKSINPLIDIINDASIFITIICISYIVIALKLKSFFLLAINLLNIILSNNLYSNSRLYEIYTWILTSDKRMLIFCIFIGFLVCIFIWKTRNKTLQENNEIKEYEKTKSSNIDTDQIAQNKITSINNKLERIELNLLKASSTNISSSNNSKLTETKTYKSRIIVNTILTILGASLVVLGSLDYILFEYLELNIQRPRMITLYTDFLHYGVIVGISVLIVLFLLNILLFCQHPLHIFWKKISNDQSTFRISGIFAIILEIIAIIFISDNDSAEITERFLNAITNNAFAAIIALVTTFLILQIILQVFLVLLSGHSDNNDITKALKKQFTEIETKIVNLACNIIGGCIALFEFIPDFFDTIGVVLFGKDDDNTLPTAQLIQEEAENEET